MNAHRYYLFANAPGAEWVRGLFLAMGDGGDAELLNCTTSLSPAANPSGLPVAWCCSFVCGEATHAALAAMVTAGQIPAGVYWCRVDALGPEEGVVRATNYPGAADRIGRVWDMGVALSLVGLAFQQDKED